MDAVAAVSQSRLTAHAAGRKAHRLAHFSGDLHFLMILQVIDAK
jgi:hypothetical protein